MWHVRLIDIRAEQKIVTRTNQNEAINSRTRLTMQGEHTSSLAIQEKTFVQQRA